MKNVFKWIYKPSGNCPVQAEGYFLGYFFYFRARGDLVTIEFYNEYADFFKIPYVEPIREIIIKRTKKYAAGWLPKIYCKFLVFKGCLMFLLSKKIK